MNLSIGTPILTVTNQTGDQSPSPDSLRQACQEFESVFTAYLLKSMRKTVPKAESALDGLDAGFSKDIYLSMMDEEIARAVSRGPGIGLAEALYRQLSQGRNP